MIHRNINSRERNDIRTFMRFVAIFCRERHEGAKALFSLKELNVENVAEKEIMVCRDCKRLLTYSIGMRLRCPHDPKPMCKSCKSQCYKGDYKEKIREIMKFSGMYLIKHGRIDLLYHYFR